MTLPEIAHCLPFVGMMAGGQQGRPYLTRLIEQSLPGIVVAAVGIYVNDRLQTEQIAALKKEVAEVKAEVRQVRADLYVPRGK